jgi:hypothetical protein
MPKGPQGRNRPADVIGNAIKVTRLRAGGPAALRVVDAGARGDASPVPG